MGAFDPNTFLDTTVTDANSTSVEPCPEGEFAAVIAEDPKFKQITSSKTGETYTILSVMFSIDDPTACEKTQRQPTKVRWESIMDLTEQGQLDMGKGKNVGLGRLREAAGLNRPGTPFSFRQLTGKMLKVQVRHRIDGDKIYDEVKAVAPL